MIPREEMGIIVGAPTLVAPFAHGAWVHTAGALAVDEDDPGAWDRWPCLCGPCWSTP